MQSTFLLRFNELISSINHSDKDGTDWIDPNKIGGLAQSIPEWQAFLEYVSSYFERRDIKNPIILEVGSQDNYQKRFYEGLLNAEYIGMEIDPDVKGDIDILGDSQDPEIIQRVKDRLKERMIDLLFLDGDHSYIGIKKDYEIYEPLTKHLIAIHDIWNRDNNDDPEFPPVATYKFWDELCENEKKYTLVSFKKNRKHERDPWVDLGIGLIVKDIK